MLFTLQCFFRRLGAALLLSTFLSSHLAVSAERTEPPTEPSGALTLATALDLAMQANPEIAVALREREAMDGVKMQSATRPNPSLSTSMQDTRSESREVYLQVNQEIELGNKRETRIAAAEALYKKATAELNHKKADIHANVVAAFYEVLAAQARLTLSQSSLEVAQQALDASTKRVKAGKSAPVEETKSKIAASSATIETYQANSLLSSARKRLAALWGNPAPVFASALGEVHKIPAIPSVETLSATLENAPAVQLAKAEIDARDGVVNIERSKTTPNITISAGVVNNQELGRNQALLGLTVPIPFFDRNQGNIQEAISRQYQAQDALLVLKNQLAANLATQYARLNAAKQAAESLQDEILPHAKSAYEVANKGFIAGKFSFLDVLDAQRTLFQMQAQYIQALLDAHQCVAEIERILGDVITHPAQQSQE